MYSSDRRLVRVERSRLSDLTTTIVSGRGVVDVVVRPLRPAWSTRDVTRPISCSAEAVVVGLDVGIGSVGGFESKLISGAFKQVALDDNVVDVTRVGLDEERTSCVLRVTVEAIVDHNKLSAWRAARIKVADRESVAVISVCCWVAPCAHRGDVIVFNATTQVIARIEESYAASNVMHIVVRQVGHAVKATRPGSKVFGEQRSIDLRVTDGHSRLCQSAGVVVRGRNDWQTLTYARWLDAAALDSDVASRQIEARSHTLFGNGRSRWNELIACVNGKRRTLEAL